MKNLKYLANEALQIQNACNVCGLAQRFAQVLIELGEHTDGTEERNTHHVTRLWLDKMNSLAGIQFFDDTINNDTISDAYLWAEKLTTEEK